jgi:hypothetical protein
MKLQQFRATYTKVEPGDHQVVLRWQDMFGDQRISVSSIEDFDTLLKRARDVIQEHIKQGKTVIIE